jgi:threonine/homoserine/homoserine lactone efflux protein
MFDRPPILISAITGFISGLVLAVPVGPVNLTIMNEGARRGFKYAALISSGALLMEFIYCALAFTGFASFFRGENVKHAMEVFSFGFILALGIWYLVTNKVPSATRVETQLEEKFHPHSAFMTGFVRVLGNLGVFGGWILLSSAFVSHGWVQPNLGCKSICVAGVTIGTGVWFFGLSYAVSLGHRKLSEKTLIRMQRGSGIGLIILALAQGIKIAWEMNKARGGN